MPVSSCFEIMTAFERICQDKDYSDSAHDSKVESTVIKVLSVDSGA